jgi:hypothetical protein
MWRPGEPKKTEFHEKVWEPFCQQYVLWSQRIVLVCSNWYLFSGIRGVFSSARTANAVIFAYTILLGLFLQIIIHKRDFRRNFRAWRYRRRAVPAVTSAREIDKARPRAAKMQARERRREDTLVARAISEAVLSALINVVLAGFIVLLFSRDFTPLLGGFVGFAVLVFVIAGGAIMSIAQFRSGRLDPINIFFGLLCSIPAFIYVAISVRMFELL